MTESVDDDGTIDDIDRVEAASGGGGGCDFFVSYTRMDADWAEWVAWQLEARVQIDGRPARVFVEAWDRVPGTNWASVRHRVLSASARVIPVLSPEYLADSRYGNAEWQAVWKDEPEGGQRRIVPVRVVECKPAGLLGTATYIDLVGREENAAQEELLQGIDASIAGRAKPGKPPPFPGPASPVSTDGSDTRPLSDPGRTVWPHGTTERSTKLLPVSVDGAEASVRSGHRRVEQEGGGSDAAGGARAGSSSDRTRSRIRSVRQPFAIAVLVTLACTAIIILLVSRDGHVPIEGDGEGSENAFPLVPDAGGRGTSTAGVFGEKPDITEYAIPTPNSGARSIILGPDGALWFVEQKAEKVGRITPDGRKIDEFPFPRGSDPALVVAGPNGYLSVLESANGGGTGPQTIARLTSSGVIAELPLPEGANVVGVANGNDGNLWFTEFAYNRIGRMDANGKITGEFPIPTPDSGPASIVLGPDGNLWFDEQKGHQIARITHAGKIDEFPYTAPLVPGTQNNHNLAAGPDGNVWFTDFWNSKIGRVAPGGDVREYAIPTDHSLPLGIVAGADGNLWFTECVPDPGRQYCMGGSKIGRSTPQGSITEFDLSDPGAGPADITVARDGVIWFTEDEGNKVGRLSLK